MLEAEIEERFSKMKPLNAVAKPNLAHIQSFYVVAKHRSFGAAARTGGGREPCYIESSHYCA